MNFVEDVIIGRRSVRKYTNESISQDKIDAMVKACFYAPMAMNKDPRELVIVTDKEKLAQIAEAHPYASFTKDAPLAIIVCAKLKKTRFDFFIDDCAASTQNIMLAAKAMGIGSCWCGVFHTPLAEKFAEIIGTPENVIPYSLIVLGYPAEEGKLPERNLENAVHYNNW